MSSSHLTLSTLPHDIIRRILQFDDGASARNLKMVRLTFPTKNMHCFGKKYTIQISRSWYLLASEYLNNHPHVEWLQLDATFKQELSVGIKLLPVHFKHFEKILQSFTRCATDEVILSLYIKL